MPVQKSDSRVPLVVGRKGIVKHHARSVVLNGADDSASFHLGDYSTPDEMLAVLGGVLGKIPRAREPGVPANQVQLSRSSDKASKLSRRPQFQPIQLVSPSGEAEDATSFEAEFPAQFELLVQETWRLALSALTLGNESGFAFSIPAWHTLRFEFGHQGADAEHHAVHTGSYFEREVFERPLTAVEGPLPPNTSSFQLVQLINSTCSALWSRLLDTACVAVVNRFLDEARVMSFEYQDRLIMDDVQQRNESLGLPISPSFGLKPTGALLPETRRRSFAIDLRRWVLLSPAMATMKKSWRAAFDLPKIESATVDLMKIIKRHHVSALSRLTAGANLRSILKMHGVDAMVSASLNENGGLAALHVPAAVLAASVPATGTDQAVDEMGAKALTLISQAQSEILTLLTPETKSWIHSQSPRVLGLLLTRPVATYLDFKDHGLGIEIANMLNAFHARGGMAAEIPQTLLRYDDLGTILARGHTPEYPHLADIKSPGQIAADLAHALLLLKKSFRPRNLGQLTQPVVHSLAECATQLLRHRNAIAGSTPEAMAAYVRDAMEQRVLPRQLPAKTKASNFASAFFRPLLLPSGTARFDRIAPDGGNACATIFFKMDPADSLAAALQKDYPNADVYLRYDVPSSLFGGQDSTPPGLARNLITALAKHAALPKVCFVNRATEVLDIPAGDRKQEALLQAVLNLRRDPSPDKHASLLMQANADMAAVCLGLETVRQKQPFLAAMLTDADVQLPKIMEAISASRIRAPSTFATMSRHAIETGSSQGCALIAEMAAKYCPPDDLAEMLQACATHGGVSQDKARNST